MVAIADNIINEIRGINQASFTKDEIIRIIKSVSGINKLPIIESDGVILNPERFEVTVKGINHSLCKKEFELLYYLISNKGKVIRKDILVRNIWGDDVIVVDRTVDVHICKLRTKYNLSNIKTVNRVGYTWKD